MKILLLALLLVSSAARAYVGETIDGLWGNVKHEAFLEIDGYATRAYFEDNVWEGDFTYYNGGNYAHKGKFEFKGTKLTLFFEYIENTVQKEEYVRTEHYRVVMGIDKSGARYIELWQDDKKKPSIGRFYHRGQGR